MNYGFSLNETVRLYRFNFKRHLIGWKWKIGSKDVFYVFILPYNRKYFYVPERQILYLKKVDYSKEFVKSKLQFDEVSITSGLWDHLTDSYGLASDFQGIGSRSVKGSKIPDDLNISKRYPEVVKKMNSFEGKIF